MEKVKNKGGRPTKYTQWIAKGICLRMMDGQSLRSICELPQYPARRTVLYWLSSKEEFLRQYTQAREIQQELLYEEMFEIADDARNDWMEREDGKGAQVNSENINRSRLRIDTRKWAMERMANKRYGNKQQVDNNVKHSFDHLTDDEIQARLAQLQGGTK